ncbi:MAG: CPBP family intramembrane metalloprotease [Bacteroidales bacterium]|nr:CPBP family intramembrane metalloprotease [Bacteroidales bacterium]
MKSRYHHTTLDWYRPGLGESWIIVLLLIAGSIFFGLFIGMMKTIAPGTNTVWETQSITYLLTFVFPAVYIAFRAKAAKMDSIMNGTEPVRINYPTFGKAGAWIVFSLAAMAVVTLSVAIEPLTSLLPMPDMMKKLFEDAFVNTRLWDAILSTCIFAPILEELLCRGIIMRGLLQKTTPMKAILWSAFIFAVIHLNPWQAIPAFIIGLLFGWLYYRTGCLWLTIFLHCLNNSISIGLTRLFPDIGIDEGLIDILPHDTYVYVYAAAVLLLAAAVTLLHRLTPQKDDE